MFIDGQLIETANFQPLARHKAHDIDFVVAVLSKRQAGSEISAHLATALQYGKGTFRALTAKGDLHTRLQLRGRSRDSRRKTRRQGRP